METINQSGFLTALGRTSLQAGVLVMVVLLTQLLFRKQLTPRWRCALWLLVVARLLLPISLSSATSIYNLFPRNASPVQFQSAALEPSTPQREMQRAVETSALPAEIPIVDVARGSEPARSEGTPATRTRSAAPVGLQAPIQVGLGEPAKPFPWALAVFGLWLAGAAALTAQILVVSVRMARRFRKSPPLDDPAVQSVLEECRNRMRVRTPLQVVESAEVTSPALYGLIRPRLLLPMGFAEKFSARELEFVFLHELAHLKRRDLWLNWLIALLQILHWFNPLIWFGFARWRADRELACDALALEMVGEGQNRAYGQTILRLLENLTHRATAPGLVGILEDKRQLHRRIGMIATYVPPRRWSAITILLVLGLALVGLTDAQTPKSKVDKPAATASSTTSVTKSPANTREAHVGADPSPEPAVTNVKTRTLTVTVLDAATGQLLPGAEVFAPDIGGWNKPQPQRRTDNLGKFTLRFASVPEEQRRQMNYFSVSAQTKDHARRAVMWTSWDGDVNEDLPLEVTLKLEQGIAIGGIVQDDGGAPLAGVRVLLSGSGFRGFRIGDAHRNTYEYSEVVQSDKESPAAISDENGRWVFTQFPSALEKVEVTFIRPDDSSEAFATGSDNPLRHRPPISLAELRAQNAVTKLGDGVNVRGIVVDEAGRPLAGATVKEGYGHHIMRVSEFTTGTDGRFERSHRAPRQWIYTASRADWATTSVVAQVEPGMSEVRIVLPPAKPLRLLVVDNSGQPVPGVEIRPDTSHNEAQILDWDSKTDTTGVVVWTNAPTAAVTLYADSKSLGARRKIKIAAGETEKRAVLSKAAAEEITVRVKAVDAVSRKAVKINMVGVNYGDGTGPFSRLAEPNADEFSVEIRPRDFYSKIERNYKFKFDADGYESLTTDWIDFEECDQNLELALNAFGGVGALTVLQPDGNPAAGAQLWARVTTGAGNLSVLLINDATGYYADRLLATERAGDDGLIKLPGAPAAAPVVIAHRNGFLDTTMGEIKHQREVRLMAYGSVEGRLLVAGKPKGFSNVTLASPSWSPSSGFHLLYSATTMPDGRFSFTEVPPGEYKLFRHFPHSMRGGPITETYQTPITVKAGETVKLDYASTGRAVVGQAIPDQSSGQLVDWQNDDHVLALKLPAIPARARPNLEDYATFEAFRKANEAFLYDPQSQPRLSSTAKTYQLMFETDGSFRVEDVPPGRYELRILVTKPVEDERERFGPFPKPEDELGSLIREVVVPEGKEPFDLGTLVVTMKDDVGAK